MTSIWRTIVVVALLVNLIAFASSYRVSQGPGGYLTRSIGDESTIK
jgi:hypothetical protein